MIEIPIINNPQKTVFRIFLADKTDNIFLDKTVIAYSESEAIEKLKLGSVIKEIGVNRENVDFYIKAAGHIYEGETFLPALTKTPVLTAEEKTACADIKNKLIVK